MVDRCICHDITLAQLKAIAQRDGLSFDALRERTRCSTGCTLCEPYVRRMLKTGETVLPILSPQEAARLCGEGRTPPPTK